MYSLFTSHLTMRITTGELSAVSTRHQTRS